MAKGIRAGNVELDVQYNANFGGDVIRFLLQDFVNNAITTLGVVALSPPPGADQVSLRISRSDASSNLEERLAVLSPVACKVPSAREGSTSTKCTG